MVGRVELHSVVQISVCKYISYEQHEILFQSFQYTKQFELEQEM